MTLYLVYLKKMNPDVFQTTTTTTITVYFFEIDFFVFVKNLVAFAATGEKGLQEIPYTFCAAYVLVC